ncbi:MAG TPA: methyltransferase domain-containing protein [Vicinamibacterales bacterium]|nr:methyltransferase domain-containing protein [Vicinamibacterales bacterium]
MTDLAAARRFFAEEVQMIATIRSTAVVEAFATLPRERFLPAGPWTVLGEGDFAAPARTTPDDNPRHVYHNVAIAIDPQRMLFNGAPTVVAAAIDALELKAGDRVLHVGAGMGYYTAIMAHCVGETGRVVAIEVDEFLAGRAADNLASMRWIEVRHGDATAPLDETFDAILINAGVTHARDTWLDALSPPGRLAMPLTAALGPTNIGKGPMLLLTRTADADVFDVRRLGFVAIFSGVGIRDATLDEEIKKALARQPFAPLKVLRRGAHPRSDGCWLHGDNFCFASR